MVKLHDCRLLALVIALIGYSHAHAQTDAIAPEELSQKISAAVKKAQDKGKREALRGVSFRVRTDGGILSIAPADAFTLEESNGFIVVTIANPDALFVVEPDTGIVRARRVDVFIQQSTSAEVDILELNPQSPCVSVLQIFQIGQKKPLNLSALEKSEQYEVTWMYPEDKLVLEEVSNENAIVRRVADGPAVVVMTLVDHKAKRRQTVEFPIRDCLDPKPVAPPPPPVVVEPEPERTLRLTAALAAGTELRAQVGLARVSGHFLSGVSLYASKPLIGIEFGAAELKPWNVGLLIGTGVTWNKITLQAQMPIGIAWQTDNPVIRLGAESTVSYQLHENWHVQILVGMSSFNTSDQLLTTGLVGILGSFGI